MSTTIKPDLRSRLAGLSGVTSRSATVYIDRLPQSESLPHIVVKRTSYDPHATLSEVDDDDMITESFTVTTRAATSKVCEELHDVVVDDLQSLMGTALGASRKVQAVLIDTASDDYEFDDFGGDIGNAVCSVSLSVIHVPQ